MCGAPKALVCVSVISTSLCLFQQPSEASKECLLAFVLRVHKGKADQFQHNSPLDKINHFYLSMHKQSFGLKFC